LKAHNSSFLDAAIAALERAAPAQNQRIRALEFLRGTLQGQPPQAKADPAGEGAPKPNARRLPATH